MSTLHQTDPSITYQLFVFSLLVDLSIPELVENRYRSIFSTSFPSYPIFRSSFQCQISHIEYDCDQLVACYIQNHMYFHNLAELENDLSNFYRENGNSF